MKNKSQKAVRFLDEMHEFVISHPQFRKSTAGRSETQIQAEIRPVIIQYLEGFFDRAGFTDPVARAHRSFYWEGQEGRYGRQRSATFGTRNYPDFIVTDPYVVAIEYKQSDSGSLVKQGIGQSIMHTLSDEFDFVYYLFHDQSSDKRIRNSLSNEREEGIVKLLWADFNVLVKIV